VKDAAILFLAIVAAGLFLIALKQHQPQFAVDQPKPVSPAAVTLRHGFVCTTPLTPNVRPVRKTEAFT